MSRIDSHQHFWKYDPVRDSWINDEMSVIRKDFYPEQLQKILEANGFDGCITVQSDQTEIENAFQLGHAMKFDFIKAVVGWVDIFTRKCYRDILVDSLKFCIDKKGLLLGAYVIMSNHVHLLARAKNGNLSDVLRDFKKVYFQTNH